MEPLPREIATILSHNGGVISRRLHPELAASMAWLVRQGRLRAVLPGVYCLPPMAGDPLTRVRAVPLWAPDAVLLGRGAAAVSFWPDIKLGVVDISAPSRHVRAAGFRLTRRHVPVELIEERGGLRYTSPALTALDLCTTRGGDGIDTALRARATTLEQLHEALAMTGGRQGNSRRRQLLLESRDEPWSAAERRCHQVLHDARIGGWRSNFPVRTLSSVYYIDVAFEQQKVALEIDGRLHEDNPGLFESDRWRQNYLVLNGWRVLRYTWTMLTQHPELVIQDVTTALALKSAPQLKDALWL